MRALSIKPEPEDDEWDMLPIKKLKEQALYEIME
jgi:hypothetical protein